MKQSSVVNVKGSYFTFDVMSHVVFYTPQNLMGDETGRAIVEEIDAAMFLAGMSVEQPLTATLPGFKRLLFRRKEKEAQAFRDKSYRFAANRVALGKEEQVRDIFANLIQDNSSAALPISTPELAADGMVMMIAGE